MKEHGIMMSGAMMRAYLAGLKWQTRRLPNTQNARYQAGDRLINSHFHNRDQAITRIPVQPDDDDVLLMDYLDQSAEINKELLAACENAYAYWREEGWSEEQEATVLPLKEAIAKAKGEL